MSDFEQVEHELKMFIKNLDTPSDCKNLEQIRFYIEELHNKIRESENKFNYAPTWAYSLLAQYDAKQSALVQFPVGQAKG